MDSMSKTRSRRWIVGGELSVIGMMLACATVIGYVLFQFAISHSTTN